MADQKGSAGAEEDAGLIRYASKAVLDQIIDAKVDAKVDLAMAEYLGALDAPAIWETIKKHDKILLGNGRPGLIEEMAVAKPAVAKFEAHLKSFSEFQIETKVDRQSFIGRFDQIEKKVDDGIAEIKKSIEPLTKLYENMTKGAVAIGFFAFLAGGLIVFLFEHGGKIMEFIKWMTTK